MHKLGIYPQDGDKFWGTWRRFEGRLTIPRHGTPNTEKEAHPIDGAPLNKLCLFCSEETEQYLYVRLILTQMTHAITPYVSFADRMRMTLSSMRCSVISPSATALESASNASLMLGGHSSISAPACTAIMAASPLE